MTWKKIHEEIEYLKLDFRHSSCSSPGPFFSSVFSGFFFCGFLSFSVGAFLLLHHGFLSSSCSFYSRGDYSSSSSVGHFVFFSSSILDLLQFFIFVFKNLKTRVLCGKNISTSAINLKSFRLDFLSNLGFKDSRC